MTSTPTMRTQVKSVSGNRVTVGAQDLHIEEKGAFTGAVSTGMLASVGCIYVLCGHSERRSVFGDSDDMVNKKVWLAFSLFTSLSLSLSVQF